MLATTARRYIGPSTPTREVGFSNTFSVLPLSPRVRARRLQGRSLHLQPEGAEPLSGRERQLRARTTTRAARFPVTAADTILNKELAVYRGAAISPEWIQKADFVKLREISLTVDVPQYVVRTSWRGVGELRAVRPQPGALERLRRRRPRGEHRTVDATSFASTRIRCPMVRRLTAGFNLQY